MAPNIPGFGGAEISWVMKGCTRASLKEGGSGQNPRALQGITQLLLPSSNDTPRKATTQIPEPETAATPVLCPDLPGRTSPACPGSVQGGQWVPAAWPPRPGSPLGLSKPLLCRDGERLVRCRVPAAAPENPILTLGRDRPCLFLPAGRGSRSWMGWGGLVWSSRVVGRPKSTPGGRVSLRWAYGAGAKAGS